MESRKQEYLSVEFDWGVERLPHFPRIYLRAHVNIILYKLCMYACTFVYGRYIVYIGRWDADAGVATFDGTVPVGRSFEMVGFGPGSTLSPFYAFVLTHRSSPLFFSCQTRGERHMRLWTIFSACLYANIKWFIPSQMKSYEIKASNAHDIRFTFIRKIW